LHPSTFAHLSNSSISLPAATSTMWCHCWWLLLQCQSQRLNCPTTIRDTRDPDGIMVELRSKAQHDKCGRVTGHLSFAQNHMLCCLWTKGCHLEDDRMCSGSGKSMIAIVLEDLLAKHDGIHVYGLDWDNLHTILNF
jgi:hypothetical protein